jgi:hypothetical protein
MSARVEQVTIEARHRGYRTARPMTTNLDLESTELRKRLDSILEGFAGPNCRDLREWSLDVRPDRSPNFEHHYTG